MKKLLVLAAIGGAVLMLKRSKDAKAEADLWREATAPVETPGATSTNGSAPRAASRPGSASEN